jgi:small membrane protein
MLIRIVLTSVFSVLLVTVLQQRALGVAFKLLSLLLLSIAVYFVLFPDVTNRIAAIAGVGRGADLIIYICMAVGAFLLTIGYIRLKGDELRVARLVQRLALEQARQQHDETRL